MIRGGAGASRTSAGGPCCWSSRGRTARNCDDELRRAVESAAAAGIEAAIARTPSAPLATVADYASLVWERDGAALFGAGASVTYVLIDAAGVVEALPLDDAALSAALDLTP